jgi:hypothetical protein
VVALVVAVASGFVRAAPAGAAPGPKGDLVLQAVACESFAAVPGNVRVDADLDETRGAYLGWGEELDGPVTARSSATLPDGCQFVAGVGFRLTADQDGRALTPRSGGDFVPVGEEDGAETTVLASRTDASGTLVVPLATLSAPQRAVLVAGGTAGLWVAALPDFPGQFANLHCYFDRYNADNLEVVRSFADEAMLPCVLWLVGASTSAAPPVPAAEPPAPEPTPSTPEGPAPPSTPPPVPTTEPPADEPAGPSTPPSVGPGPGGGPPIASLDPTGPSAPAPEQAVPALTGSFAVRVEVGGVTRGIDVDRPVGSESSWQAPLRVRYGCGDVARTYDIVPPRAPGYAVVLDAIELPAAGASCEIVTVDDGSRGRAPELTLGRERIVMGASRTVEVPAGEDTVVTLIVNYAGTLVGVVERPVPATTTTTETPEAALAAPAPDAGSQLTPVVGAALGTVFVLGLVLSVLAARRPL